MPSGLGLDMFLGLRLWLRTGPYLASSASSNKNSIFKSSKKLLGKFMYKHIFHTNSPKSSKAYRTEQSTCII